MYVQQKHRECINSREKVFPAACNNAEGLMSKSVHFILLNVGENDFMWYLQSHAYCSLQRHCPLDFSLFCKASYSSTETFRDPKQPTWKQRHVRMLPCKDDWWTATRVVYSKQNTSSEVFQKKTTHTASLQNAADTDPLLCRSVTWSSSRHHF